MYSHVTCSTYYVLVHLNPQVSNILITQHFTERPGSQLSNPRGKVTQMQTLPLIEVNFGGICHQHNLTFDITAQCSS